MTKTTCLNTYIKNNREADGMLVKRITCLDGFSLSVQACLATYSSPQDNVGPYTEVEVGFHSEEPELILAYADDIDRPTETVFGHVPIEIVEEIINLHGGIKND